MSIEPTCSSLNCHLHDFLELSLSCKQKQARPALPMLSSWCAQFRWPSQSRRTTRSKWRLTCVRCLSHALEQCVTFFFPSSGPPIATTATQMNRPNAHTNCVTWETLPAEGNSVFFSGLHWPLWHCATPSGAGVCQHGGIHRDARRHRLAQTLGGDPRHRPHALCPEPGPPLQGTGPRLCHCAVANLL